MQATVRIFDPVSRMGSVLLDDGIELPFDAAAFAAGGMRLLRVGQRVRIELDGSPEPRDQDTTEDTRVTFLTVATMRDTRE